MNQRTDIWTPVEVNQVTSPGKHTNTYWPGMRVALTQNEEIKFFEITNVEYDVGENLTSILLDGKTLYELSIQDEIAWHIDSTEYCPKGFPIQPSQGVGGWREIGTSELVDAEIFPEFSSLYLPAGVLTNYRVGDRLKLVQDGEMGDTYYIIMYVEPGDTGVWLQLFRRGFYPLSDMDDILSVSISSERFPFGFIGNDEWRGLFEVVSGSQSTPSPSVWYNTGGNSITIPPGEWIISFDVRVTTIGTTDNQLTIGLATSDGEGGFDELDPLLSLYSLHQNLGTCTQHMVLTPRRVNFGEETTLYLIVGCPDGDLTSMSIDSGIITLECVYF